MIAAAPSTKILSSDILIADVISSHINNRDIQALVLKHGMRAGEKIGLHQDAFPAFQKATDGRSSLIEPGGSSANMLTTLSKLMDRDVDVTFLGVIGNEHLHGRTTPNGNPQPVDVHDMIKTSLDEARIRLLPDLSAYNGTVPQTAISHVVVYPDGQRTIATFSGNAHKILNEAITNEMAERLVKDTDVVFLQGSLWKKFGAAFADRLVDLRWKHKKELWLALPTYSQFGWENRGRFQWLLKSANLVLANIGELARTCNIMGDEVSEAKMTKDQKEAALHALQNAFRAEGDDFRAKGERFYEKKDMPHRNRQVGFITLGNEGAAVVTANDIIYVKAAQVDVANTLGAGDTAFAGFAAGYLKHLSPETCAQIAVALAGENIKVEGPRIPKPREALHNAARHLCAELFEHSRNSAICI
jgi:sugar/nucleoside kinase (ribokinase family)